MTTTQTIESRLDQLGFHHDMVEPHHGSSMGWVSWILIASLSLNVAVIAFLVLQLRDGALWFEVEMEEPAIAATLSQSEPLKTQVGLLAQKNDDELIRALDDESIVANGYRVQELALALLRSRGYLVEDPLRPLGAWPQPMSAFTWTGSDGTAQSLSLFSTLGVREVQAVKAFLLETAVPFTSEGIVRRMKEGKISEAMKSALLRTDEWILFSRVFATLGEEDLISACQELGGAAFTDVVVWGRIHSDPQEVGPFLLALFAKYPTSILAELLASKWADVIVLQAPDAVVLSLYSALPPQSDAGVRLAMRILHGQRKLPVWQASQAYLARAASMPTLSAMNRDQVLEWLQQMAHSSKAVASAPPTPPLQVEAVPKKSEVVPTIAPKTAPPQPIEKLTASKPVSTSTQVSARAATRQLRPYQTYVVKKGDTLWSVAKRFNVDVEKLKYLNRLKGSTLVPGKVLRIPH
jgi:LysM repeat protein